MRTFAGPQWSVLFHELLKHKGTAIIIGATDTGKSTLARYLVRRFISKNIVVSLVDSDVGQSSLGLPGTVSMKVFHSKKDLEEYRFEKMVFIGSVNPATKIPLIIEACQRMTDMSRKKSDVILVDTSGLVSGEVGKALKLRKIKKISPDHVIGLERDDEVEHILLLIKNTRIYRLEVSRMATERNRIARRRYREQKLRDYFGMPDVTDFLLCEDDLPFYYNGRIIKPNDREFSEGTIIGLNKDADTRALGVVREISRGSLTFASRLRSLRNINNAVLGDITLNEVSSVLKKCRER